MNKGIKKVEETAKPVMENAPEIPKNVINLDMQDATRSTIWVNGDCTKVLKLNLTDLGIVERYNEVYPKLDDLQNEISNMLDELKPEEATDSDELNSIAQNFKSVNSKMKEYVDYIFDYTVCDVCCDGGSMYDVVANGQYRFEYIIEKLSKLYGDAFNTKHKAMQDRLKSHTSKYTKKKSTGK